MSDESMKGPVEMERDLKEYLACFKKNASKNADRDADTLAGNRSNPKATPPAKTEMHKTKCVLDSSAEDSLSENSSFFGASPPHKKFNLQDINDLQTSQPPSESETISPSTLQGDDSSESAAIDKLVLSLKELGSTPEDGTLNSDTMDNTATSSFNIKANVFTVDDLLVASDIDTASKSTADESMVTDKAVDHDDELSSYKDDFENDDDESTIVEESFGSSESIKEFISSSDATGTQHSESSSITQSTNTTTSSSHGGKGSTISYTEETQSFSASQDTNTSAESSLSRHEVAIQTDPSWKILSQQGAINGAFTFGEDRIQRSEGETMTLHNLVTQQLQLTRNLIDTARSLHHSQTVAICPDYHYVTLEDTKQFIETHKPKVLKMKK